MAQGMIFSWAENAEGKMVHVDNVPRGMNCGCTCPNCHEQLIARHGNVNEHGFAHHSETRGANLKICYNVIMYKLAEQIIQTKKQIRVPSYYGIFKETVITFREVEIDSRYEREDKQPDVIATTGDGRQYLIEFVFRYKVRHRQKLDYSNQSCIEIDLSNQSLESLEPFLLSSSNDRKWLNCENYFQRIEDTYLKAGKAVKTVREAECQSCVIKDDCCAVTQSFSPMIIENSGVKYRLCKKELFDKRFQERRARMEEERARKKELEYQKEQMQLSEFRRIETRRQEEQRKWLPLPVAESSSLEEDPVAIDPEQRTCFLCQANLTWKSKGGERAYCGCFISMGLPSQKVDPNHAKQCRGFKMIKS